MPSERYCEWCGCDRPARDNHNRFCAMHMKRRQRGTDMDALPDEGRERMSPHERLVYAAIKLADADSEDDRAYRAADNRLKAAALSWVEQLTEKRRG